VAPEILAGCKEALFSPTGGKTANSRTVKMANLLAHLGRWGEN
jgi:hypothetical protein